MIMGQSLIAKSSFLSVDKDLSLIVDKMLGNQNLVKLLFYTDKDCLKKPDLTQRQKLTLVDKQLRLVPRLTVEEDCPNYVIITMNNFRPNGRNPEFRDCTISFDILCHPDHWSLGNFGLRPYKIAGEIDSMLNKAKLTGIGEVQFTSAVDLSLNKNLMGLTMNYEAIHGIEDQINPLS